jgi:hypothetical protein
MIKERDDLLSAAATAAAHAAASAASSVAAKSATEYTKKKLDHANSELKTAELKTAPDRKDLQDLQEKVERAARLHREAQEDQKKTEDIERSAAAAAAAAEAATKAKLRLDKAEKERMQAPDKLKLLLEVQDATKAHDEANAAKRKAAEEYENMNASASEAVSGAQKAVRQAVREKLMGFADNLNDPRRRKQLRDFVEKLTDGRFGEMIIYRGCVSGVPVLPHSHNPSTCVNCRACCTF